jgi:DNA-binding NarL/FixJ family response regulator
MPPEPRVLVVSSSPMVRAGLENMLSAHGFLIRSAASLSLVSHDGPGETDVCVMDEPTLASQSDLALPAGAGLVVLDRDASSLQRLRSLAPGAWALLHVDGDGGALAAAIRAVHARLTVLSPAFEVDAFGVALAPSEPLEHPLSEREREVLEAAGRGLPSKLIAAEIGLSESTIKFHLSAAYAKLGAASRTEAVSKAARRGLITL